MPDRPWIWILIQQLATKQTSSPLQTIKYQVWKWTGENLFILPTYLARYKKNPLTPSYDLCFPTPTRLSWNQYIGTPPQKDRMRRWHVSRWSQKFHNHKLPLKMKNWDKVHKERKAGARPPSSEREADPSQARTNHKAGQKPSLVLFSLDCLKVLPRNRRIPLNRYLPQLSIWGLWQAALPLCVWPIEHMEWLRKLKGAFSGENRTEF